MEVIIIVAVSANGVIGIDGKIPWTIPDDLQRFKELTMGHPVVMGRKTWGSLPKSLKPLPGRQNYIMTRDVLGHGGVPGVTITNDSPKELLSWFEMVHREKVFIIGGAEIYALFLPFATHLEITEVDLIISPGSLGQMTFFPPWNSADWVLDETQTPFEFKGPRYKFKTYIRKGVLD